MMRSLLWQVDSGHMTISHHPEPMNMTYLENLSFADKMMTMILTLGYHAQVGVLAHAYNSSPWGWGTKKAG